MILASLFCFTYLFLPTKLFGDPLPLSPSDHEHVLSEPTLHCIEVDEQMTLAQRHTFRFGVPRIAIAAPFIDKVAGVVEVDEFGRQRKDQTYRMDIICFEYYERAPQGHSLEVSSCPSLFLVFSSFRLPLALWTVS